MPAARLIPTDIPRIMSELGKIVADHARACQRRAAPAEKRGSSKLPRPRLCCIVLIGRALYIPEATQAAEISPNFRPQIGHIGR
jgi:hypothetical protein